MISVKIQSFQDHVGIRLLLMVVFLMGLTIITLGEHDRLRLVADLAIPGCAFRRDIARSDIVADVHVRKLIRFDDPGGKEQH